MRTTPGLMLVAATVAGCGASYIYAPQDATLWRDGYPTQRDPVPPEAPQGQAEITSFGVVEIKPAGAATMPVIHVRMAITNEGDATPWAIDPSQQEIEIADEGRSRPIYVNTDLASLPTISIAQRERRVLDFYYPLPATMADDDDLPGFDFLWQITTGSRQYSWRTRFVRYDREPPAEVKVVYVTGWGAYWWYDPYYPHVVFRHPRPVHGHGHGGVIITRPPSRHYLPTRDHRS